MQMKNDDAQKDTVLSACASQSPPRTCAMHTARRVHGVVFGACCLSDQQRVDLAHVEFDA